MATPVSLQPRNFLTPSQELIWISQRLSPDAPLQNMATISSFAAAIEPDRFIAAVDEVIRGSDVLRTVVRELDGVPHPSVLPAPPRRTEVITVSPHDLDHWMNDRISTPLDVSVAMYDSVLIDHGDGAWAWWLDVHHLACDAASSALFFNAVADAYFGSWTAPTPYSDLVSSLLADQSNARRKRAVEHWATTEVPVVETHLYRPDIGPGTAADRVGVPMGALRRSKLETLLVDRFRMISPDLSLTAVLATVLAAYISRTQQGPIVFGLPVSNRSTREARTVFGPLVEFFPVVVDVSPDDTFVSLHERVSAAIFEVLRYAHPGTSPRQSFDILLNVHAATFGAFGPIATESRWVHPGHIDPHHRLRLQALDYTGSGELEIALDINHRIADSDHRLRAAGHFGAVLDAMLDRPEQLLSNVGLIGGSERALLAPFTEPDRGTPLDGVTPDVVRERLEANGSAPALSEAGRVLSGAQVNECIAAAAKSLRLAGFGVGDVVAIEMPLGIAAVIALHGVLRAGAAFVPIDTTYPKARRDHIRTDSGARLTITSLAQLLALGGPGDSSEVAVGDDVAISLDDLAYVIYTSGSTGRPKGVPITHRGLSEYLGFAQATYVDAERPVMPLFTSLSFDLTITTLFLPFLAGGLMPVYPEGGLGALRSIVDDASATIVKATPSHLELLVRMIGEDHPLSCLIVGGEAFGTDLADRLLAAMPSVSIYNEYGPTEAVVGCMQHRYDPVVDTAPEVPIGRPAPGVGLHVLDPNGHQVPLGVAGELYITRPGMTVGYLDRPDLNSEKFVELPNSGTNSVLYRTGDRVRMLDADRMVYLGRIDDQIKIGGIRLEPGEIEAAALTVPGVHRAVAGLWVPGERQSVESCVRCGLGSDVPAVTIDGDGICSSCHDYDLVAVQAEQWFRDETDLVTALDDARNRSTGQYDVLHLISGGKDSTYALHKLVELGARVYAITLDNGFIAEVAKDNVRRATSALGVEHEFVTVDAMNEIFRDSLERFSNVCNGCYKAIYTVALERAEQLGIASIVTGLSRGQFFETRLVPGMFAADRFDPNTIDSAVTEARRVYHTSPDAVLENMETGFLEDGTIFDRINFIDFYRYVDVELSELYEALDSTGIWLRPPDSGRSTNCLINAAGIFVHKIEQGHHNYALPYSWDVRLGHKTRDEALFELDDPIGSEELVAITSMLAEVGYEPRLPEVLTLWIEADPGVDRGSVDLEAVRETLRNALPAHAVPRAIEMVEEMPLSPNGKVDMSSLPAPAARRIAQTAGEGRLPQTTLEHKIAEIWESVLGCGVVSVTDDFFALGGTSLHALEMIVRLSDVVGAMIPESLPFKKRTVADLAVEVESLIAAHALTGEVTAIPHLGDDSVPLSDGEQAMLYEWRRDPSDRRYNVARLYRLQSGYDRKRFDRAVRAVVAHQATLHTSYAESRSRLSIDDAVRISVRSSADEPLDVLARRLNEETFDLVKGPLLTVDHLESSADGDDSAPTILIRTHHIVSDAGSLDVFWNQVDLAYRGESLPELEVSYAAFGEYQRSRGSEPDMLWVPHADDPPGDLQLRPAGSGPDGYVHVISDISTDALRGGPGTTPFATALTALAVALAPYHSKPDFEICVTSSVRDHPAAAEIVGYFLNPLPLIVEVDSDLRGSEVGSLISDRLAAALEHRSTPFAAVVRNARERGVQPPRSAAMLAFEELAVASLAGVEVEHEILSSGTAVNDLTFFVQIRGPQVELGVEYRGEAVGREQAELLLTQFGAALRALLEAPSDTVKSTTSTPTPLRGPPLIRPARHVGALIFEQLAKSASSAAVSSRGARVSYAELDERAHALAGRLRAAGVDAGDRVGVVLPRSVDLPTAILATWMIGASYVPIDVGQPAPRVTELVAASGIRVALTCGDGHAGLTEVTTIFLDQPDPAVLPIRAVHDPSLDDEAYVIFTSGSTGRPKGVPVSHANLAASVAARLQWYGGTVERFLLLSSAGFDSSVAGLFWTLVHGGELVIPTESEVHDVDALLDLIEATLPSHMLCVPSLYGALLKRRGTPLPGLRTVIVAGEACPPDLVIEHDALSSRSEMVNEYGPTEATVWATAHRCSAGDPFPTVPIGGPIPGVMVEVVDSAGRNVPIDVAGELMISGPTVVGGYLDASDTSRFGSTTDGSSYNTGDRVVRRDTGVLEFLGRVDEQLSVGGVRIEPSEIEHALISVEGVAVAAVGVRSAKLVGWVEGDSADPATVRRIVAQRLAPTHVPSRIIVVAALPRNSNGKIDRGRLEELPVTDSDRAVAVDVTRRSDPMLTTMLDMWRQAFAGEAVNPDDDFFELGGDSLRAVDLVSLLEEQYGRRVAIGELVDAPTPASLLERFRQADHVQLSGVAPARTQNRSSVGLVEWLRSSGDQSPLVVLPPGGGNLIRYAPLVRALDDELPVLGLRLPGADARSDTVDTIEAQATEMLAALDSTAIEGPYRLLGWSTGGLIAWEMARILTARGDRVDWIALVDTVMGGMHVEPQRSITEKYAAMYRADGAPAVVSEGVRRGAERAGFALARYRYRASRRKGETPSLADAERQLGPVVRRAALSYRPEPLPASVIYFSASESANDLTVDPWSALQRDAEAFEVIGLDGVHFLPEVECIIGPSRVGQLVAELTKRGYV